MLTAPVAIVGLHLRAEIAPRRTLTRRYQVSTQGGRQPRGRGDSKELFYLSPTRNSIVGVSVDEKADSISLGTLASPVQFRRLWSDAFQHLRYDSRRSTLSYRINQLAKEHCSPHARHKL